MRYTKYFLFAILTILILLFAIPFLFKGKIVKLIKEQANEQLNAKLEFNESIGLSLIKNFPNLSISIEDLSLVGVQDFEKDTLFSAKNIALTFDLMSIINGEQIQIRKIILDQPRINALVLSNGKANWDIAKVDTTAAVIPADTSASKFNVKLKQFEIINGYILYNDKEGDMYSELCGMNHTLEGDFTDVLFTMKNKLSIESLTFVMEGLNYLNHVKAFANADIEADMNNFKFVFKENEIGLNQLLFAFDGSFAMPGDNMVMDITYAAKQNEFKNFLSLVPAIYSNDFKDLQSKGKLAFDGFVKGTYNEKQMPSFGLNLGVANGWFKYPALPAPFENVELKLSVQNPDGDLDHTEINLSKLHFELQGDAFDAKLYAKNLMSDPYLDAFAKGVLNLDNIVKIVPLPAGTTLHGLIKTDITAKGNVSTLGKENYEAFNAFGNIIFQNIYYASPDLLKPFELSKSEMSFSPKILSLKSFEAKIGNSDMQMSGDLANFFPYYFGKGVLKGTLNFYSNVFDANEYLTEQPTATTAVPDTASMTVFEVPKDIDFTIKSNIKKMLYTNMEITNFVGNIQVVNQELKFQNVALNTLGSAMKMTGYYETKNPKKPSVDMDFSLSNLDFQKAFQTFNTVKKLVPAAENIFGTFSTTFKMKFTLDEHMQPNCNTLFAEGMMTIPSAEIKGIKVLDQITDLIKKPEYKKLGFYNAKIAYKVENGRINTKPFDVKFGPQMMNLSGSTGLDQTIDYVGKVNIPRKDLGAADDAITNALLELNKAAGTSIKASETFPIKIGIGGTFASPKITTNFADLAKGEANSIKDQALEEAKRKQKELTDKAKAELDKATEEAKVKIAAEADRVKKETEAKAKAEADRLKKEADAKIKAEANKMKNKAADEAKKKLKGFLNKSDTAK